MSRGRDHPGTSATPPLTIQIIIVTARVLPDADQSFGQYLPSPAQARRLFTCSPSQNSSPCRRKFRIPRAHLGPRVARRRRSPVRPSCLSRPAIASVKKSQPRSTWPSLRYHPTRLRHHCPART